MKLVERGGATREDLRLLAPCVQSWERHAKRGILLVMTPSGIVCVVLMMMMVMMMMMMHLGVSDRYNINYGLPPPPNRMAQ